MDHLVPGEVHRPEVLSVVPGGKALNVARAAANLGMPVRAIAVLGGHAGDWLEAALRDRGIATRVVRAAGETRTCLSVLDRADGTLTEFYEPGLILDDAGWTAVETALRSELADDPAGSVVVLAGSLPPGAPDAGYARLTKIANDAGARAVVDADRSALARALRNGRGSSRSTPGKPRPPRIVPKRAIGDAGAPAAADAAAEGATVEAAHGFGPGRAASSSSRAARKARSLSRTTAPSGGSAALRNGDGIRSAVAIRSSPGSSSRSRRGCPWSRRRDAAVPWARRTRSFPARVSWTPADAERMLPAIGIDRIA